MKKKLRSLSIGNSFSEDALAYVHCIAEAAGIEWTTYNLYIGGCSLETHWNNYQKSAADYTLIVNGQYTRPASINEMLANGSYDIVTTQQASHFSGKPETYQPYLTNLAAEIRKAQPSAKLYLQETWAYEIDSNHGAFPDYGCDQRQMYDRLSAAYRTAADSVKADIIPVGDVIQYLRENVPQFYYKNGGKSLNRDGFHLSIPYGRYINSAVWFETILGEDVRKNSFTPMAGDIPADRELIERLQNYVHDFLHR